MRVRTHLALLAAAVFLPVILGSAIAIRLLLDAERQAVLRSMQELARATALTMDRELTAALASGQALTTSLTLFRGDFATFYSQAKSANAGTGRDTALLRADGEQVFNTARPYGAPSAAPSAATRLRVRTVLERGVPVVSDLIVGGTARRFVVAAQIPVTLGDGRAMVLGQRIDARRLNAMLPGDVPGSWLISVFDRAGRTIARNRGWDEYVAGQPRPAVLAALRAGTAIVRGESREGTPMYAALVRSPLSGWTAAVGVPVAELEATAAHAVALTAGTLLCAVALACLGALLFARRLLRATEYLSTATEGMVDGWLPPPADLRITELNALQKVLHAVSTRLIRLEGARQRHLAEAQAARSLAEAQNRAKDEFLAMLGHELRNPLGAISSAIALIQMGASGQAAERAHQIIGRQSRHLGHLVDELLDANRVLSGRVTRAPVPLDLAAAVREVASTLQTQGTTAEHTVDLDLEPVWVHCDPTRLQQVIGNLIENAAKYTQAGGRIRVSVRGAGGMAELAVADDGKGIDADLLPRIWDVFVQGKVLSRAKGGLGIGLAVVKSLVEQHRGSVAVASGGPQRGSTFTVRLPLAGAAHPGGGADDTAVPAPPPGRRVLLVEDNDDLRDMTCALLQARGCTVLTAAGGKAALALAARHRPDVAFVDIDLPDISGYDVARALARQGGIRLVAVTGYGQPDDVRRALDAGFDLHLKKPVRLDELERALGETDAVR
jgi:signal transduction histidine kinase/CheY-like chemotaxis protein